MTTTITPNTISPVLADIAAARELVERHLAEAKAVADRLRVRHARALLEESFPGHTLAVFTRNWDEDEINLIQLIGDGETDDIDDYEKAVLTDQISRDQAIAWASADRIIAMIGGDDDMSAVLESPSEEHEGYVEFDLRLHSEGDSKEPLSHEGGASDEKEKQ